MKNSTRRYLISMLPLALVFAVGCGSSDSGGTASGSSPDNSGGNGGSAGQSGGGGQGGGLLFDGGNAEPCPGGCDGGVCVNGTCCEASQVCGDTCCQNGQVCSFGKCQVPGDECLDGLDCSPDQYCEYALGANDEGDAGTSDAGTCHGGAVLRTGRCMPKPPKCPDGVEPKPGEPITCLPECEYHPNTVSFQAVQKAAWTKGNIMMAPVVIELDDDNCDGKVNERDIPEIVFTTFDGSNYHSNGTLWAISLVDGKFVDKWHAKPSSDSIHPGVGIAAGNIDGKNGNEVVVCTSTGKVRAFSGSGKPMWTSEQIGRCLMPSLGDLDHDGRVEVVVEGGIIDGATGKVKARFSPEPRNIVLSDMDGDGKLDIVAPNAVFKADGTLLASTKEIEGVFVAVGDFDKDGVPEVATTDYYHHLLHVWHLDPTNPKKIVVLRSNVDINGTNPNVCSPGSAGHTRGGGPPTIADFNADGTPDVAVAGGIGYTVLDGTKILDSRVPANKTNLWIVRTHDCSSADTGSSLFDFNGDGKPEVVYSDEHFLHIYEGTTGKELFRTCNTTGTLAEYPLVADVDADGKADLVVVANDYSTIVCPTDKSKQRGVRVFGSPDGSWVRTRRVWNQHAYHVTNVEESGEIPRVEKPNWKQPRLNNFRQNTQPGSEFSAPDLVVSVSPDCPPGKYLLVATVRNLGTASVPPGVVVGFYQGDPDSGGKRLGQKKTTQYLYPAEAENVVLDLGSGPKELLDGTAKVYAVVDDGHPAHSWHQCRESNDKAGPVSGKCQDGPK